MTKDPKKIGRPVIKVDLRQVEKLAMLGCTIEEAAAFLDIGKQTLLRRLEEPEYRKVWDHGQEKGKVSLRRLQWKHANGAGGSAVSMAIHLAKHRLGETDKSLVEVTGRNGGPISIMDAARLAALPDEELTELERILSRLASQHPSDG